MTLEVPPGGTKGQRMPTGSLASGGARIFASLVRLTGGRIGGGQLLLLTTVGAKSGKPRIASVRRFDDGDGRWMIVASANAAAHNPGWLHNMAAHPDQVWIEIGKEKIKVRPETLWGDERAVAWERIVREAPNFGPYPTKTDREIAMVRLTRETEGR